MSIKDTYDITEIVVREPTTDHLVRAVEVAQMLLNYVNANNDYVTYEIQGLVEHCPNCCGHDGNLKED